MTDEMMTREPEPAEPTIVENEPTTNLEAPEANEADIETDAETTEGELENQEPEIELLDVEYEGKQYKLPTELKDALLRQADYTRKTQETAARQRELEQRAQTLAQQAQASEDELKTRAEIIGLDQQLEQYKALDWNMLEQGDPMAVQGHWRNFQLLKERRQELTGTLDTMQRQRAETAQQETARRIQETRDFAAKNIKGWSNEVDAKVTSFAVEELGFQPQEIMGAVNPAIYRTLYLAWVGQQTLSKQQAPKPTTVQPLKTVAGQGGVNPRKSLAEMNMDEYVAARRKGA